MLLLLSPHCAWTAPKLSSGALNHMRKHHLAVVRDFIDDAFVGALVADVEGLLRSSQPAANALDPPSAGNGAVRWYELLPNAPARPQHPLDSYGRLAPERPAARDDGADHAGASRVTHWRWKRVSPPTRQF